MNLRRASLLLLTGLCCALPVLGHHSFAMFDFSRDVKITGVVKEFRFVNPHAMLYVDATDKAGKTVSWKIELAGRLNLTNHDWKPDTIKPGERVTITGKPHRSEPLFMSMVSVQLPDGSVLIQNQPDTPEDVLDKARQERAKQRKAGP